MTEPTPIILSSPDAGNRSAGEMLRLAREEQRMTLETLASLIKVTPAKLEALEQGQYDRLPDANFTRALAMTVCRALRLDPTPVLAMLPAAKPTALAEGKPPLNQPFKDVRGGSPLFDHQGVLGNLLTLKWLAPIGLLVAALLVYVLPDNLVSPDGLRRWLKPASDAVNVVDASTPAASMPSPSGVMPSDAITASAATVPVVASSAAAAASMPASSASVPTLVLDSAASAPVPAAWHDPRLVAASASASPVAAVPGVASGAIALNVSEAAWIEVRDGNGVKLLSRQVAAGERLNLDGPAPISLRIGNAAGVQLAYKGQPVDLVPLTRNNVARVELK
jgi:cytoskeleton protein RodZ